MTPSGLVLLRMRLLQGYYSLKSLPWLYRFLIVIAVVAVLWGTFQAAIARIEVWLLLNTLPILFRLLRNDHYSVLRRLEHPFLAQLWESSPLWLLLMASGAFHHPGYLLLPPLIVAAATQLPAGLLAMPSQFYFSLPALLRPYFCQETRSVWHTQAPWLLILMLLTLPALLIPALSLWLTALFTLVWAGPVLQCESWMELRASGKRGAVFFFHQVRKHAQPLMVWSIPIAVAHAFIHPELAWLSLALPTLQLSFLTLLWAIRYAYWHPNEASSGSIAASVAAIGLLIPILAPVIIVFLVYYLPRSLYRLHHELLP
jgi:hypothetical protein